MQSENMEEKEKNFVLVASFLFIISVTILWFFNLFRFRNNIMNIPLFASIYAASLLFLTYIKKELGVGVGLKLAPLSIAASFTSIAIASSQAGVSVIAPQTILSLLIFIMSSLVIAYEG